MRSPGSTSNCPCEGCQERRKKQIQASVSKAFAGFAKLLQPAGDMNRMFRQQLVNVQPMTAPVGGVFYLDYTYGETKTEEEEIWIDY